MVKFSVVIPTYNCYEYISETIESVLSQTYKDFEIIVVDDGSTDSSIEILNKYSDHIKIHSQQNCGVSAARNTGAKLSCGEYLAFLDSDDIWLENKLQKQYIKINDGFDICYSNKYNFGEIGDLPLIQTDVFQMPEGFIYEQLLFENVIATSSVVMKKSIFNSLGGFDESLIHGEDWDLWLRCAEKYHIGVNLEPLLKYRLRSGGHSQGYKSMNRGRQIVIKNALTSEYSRSMSKIKRKRALSTAYSCSAWESAKCKDYLSSFQWFCKSLGTYPFDTSVWYDFARMICGRI